jgi:hypothetical protein
VLLDLDIRGFFDGMNFAIFDQITNFIDDAASVSPIMIVLIQ